MDFEDPRRRPVVLQTGRAEGEPQPRSRRFLAWAGTGVVGLVAAAGLVAGGTAVWTAFDPGTPGRSPAPLWFSPPEPVVPVAPEATRTPDDHGGDRSPSASETTADKGSDGRGSGDERDDDKGEERVQPTSGTSTDSGKHDSDDSGKSGSGSSGSGTSGSGSGTSGSGSGSSGSSGSGGSSGDRDGDR